MILRILIVALFPLLAHAGWVSGTLHVRDDNSVTPNAVFINSYTPVGPAAGAWVTIDVSSLGIPPTAKSVFLSGILIVTHGTNSVTCDLTISFRAPGNSMTAGNYIGQAIEAAVGGGQRSTMSTWAPVKDGKIEFQWNRNTFANWPTDCAYGINLSAQAYVD